MFSSLHHSFNYLSLNKKELSTLVPDEILDDEAIETTMVPKTKFEDEDEIETTMMPMIDDDMVSTYTVHIQIM